MLNFGFLYNYWRVRTSHFLKLLLFVSYSCVNSDESLPRNLYDIKKLFQMKGMPPCSIRYLLTSGSWMPNLQWFRIIWLVAPYGSLCFWKLGLSMIASSGVKKFQVDHFFCLACFVSKIYLCHCLCYIIKELFFYINHLSLIIFYHSVW